jgi:uncharacterized phage protein gp47/JayE
MAGVTDEGFEVETVDSLKTEIENELKNEFGSSFNVRPTSVAGIIIGVFAQKLADLWDAAEAIYGSQYPESAFGQSLDQVAILTGVQRLPATRSTATIGITGTAATVIPALSRIRNSDTNSYWRITEDNGDVTIPIGGSITAAVESEDFGEVLGVAGSLDTIDTVVAGWTSVNNAADATLGREVETDAELRSRRASLLVSQGKATVDAIAADVLAVDDVLEAVVFENVTLITDANGVPGKAFEVVLYEEEADSDEIFQAIWDSKPAGISAYGTTVGTAVDSLGADRYVAYTPATTAGIYVSITAVTTGGSFEGLTANLVDSIKAAITAYGDGLGIGDDVIRIQIIADAMNVEGVYDHTGTTLDRYAAPTATSNISIGIREIAKFDTSRIAVILT